MSNASDGTDSTDNELADAELDAVAGGAFATNLEPGVEIAGGTSSGHPMSVTCCQTTMNHGEQ